MSGEVALSLKLPEPEGLRFDEEEHKYYLDGAEIPSVTQTLKEAGLVDVSYCTEYARDRGSRVHRAIHYMLQGDLDPESVSPSIAGYLSAAEDCLRSLNAETLFVESRVLSRVYQYAGTLDWLGMIDGLLTISDHKTGDPGMAGGWQTAGYADALFEMTGKRVARRMCFRYYPDGRFSVTEFKRETDTTVFRAALVIAKTKREMGWID